MEKDADEVVFVLVRLEVGDAETLVIEDHEEDEEEDEGEDEDEDAILVLEMKD